MAILASLCVCGLLLAAQGKPPLAGVWSLIAGGFGDWWAVQDVLLKACPIFLCALGVAIAFRMRVYSIGAEGQFALGAVGGSWAALAFAGLPAPLAQPLLLLAAALTGGLFALIPALLKVRLRVNEILATLMLNYVGAHFLEYLVYGPWRDPESHGFPMTRLFPPEAVIGAVFDSRLHWGLLLCLPLGLLIHFFFTRTRLGFELRMAGESQEAARYARMPYGALVILAMTLGGALAGLAGAIETSASAGRLQPSVMAGYGYTAIVVAWIARLSPLGVGLASLFLAALRVGVENLQLEMQVPVAFGGVVEGMILLAVLASQFFANYRFVRLRKAPDSGAATGAPSIGGAA